MCHPCKVHQQIEDVSICGLASGGWLRRCAVDKDLGKDAPLPLFTKESTVEIFTAYFLFLKSGVVLCIQSL